MDKTRHIRKTTTNYIFNSVIKGNKLDAIVTVSVIDKDAEGSFLLGLHGGVGPRAAHEEALLNVSENHLPELIVWLDIP